MVATRLGGIQDQIVDGVSGLLIKDADNLAEYGAAVVELLADPERARRIGDRRAVGCATTSSGRSIWGVTSS